MLNIFFRFKETSICELCFTVKCKHMDFNNNWCQLWRGRIKGVVCAVGWSSITKEWCSERKVFWKEGRLVQERNEIWAGYHDPPPHPTTAELCWYFLRAKSFMQSRRDAGIGVRKLIRSRSCFVILQLGNKTWDK